MAFGSLVTALGLAAIKGEVKSAARRLTRKVAFAVIMLLFLALAFGFALAALTVWLSAQLGTLEALGLVAAIFLFLSLVVWGIAAVTDRSSRRRRHRPPPPPPPRPTTAPADGETPPAASVAGSLAVIAVVGFVLARQLFRR